MRVLIAFASFICLTVGFLPTATADITPNPIILEVPCDSAVATLSTGNLPAGIYSVAVVGACIFDTTPQPTTWAPCVVTVAAASTQNCMVNLTPCFLAVAVDGQCLSLGSAGFVNHAAGQISAVFVDTFYPDNLGTFVVVLQQVN